MVVKVYGATWCPACQKLKAHLRARAAVFQWCDIDQSQTCADEHANAIATAGGPSVVPVVDVDGTILVGPSLDQVDAAMWQATPFPWGTFAGVAGGVAVIGLAAYLIGR